MKLRTSRILAQLSEQDRNKAEAELAELNGLKQQLIRKQHDSRSRIQQLNIQRDQAMRNRNAASLLQTFDLSLREQQGMLNCIGAAISELEQKKQALLARFAEVYRTQHAYERIHQKAQRKQNRQDEIKRQRQLDDIVAARSAATA